MTEEHGEGQSFYDFLIDDPEMMAPAPPGHDQLQQQQPISPPNRTSVASHDLQPRQDPTELQTQTHHHAIHHPGPASGFGRQLPLQSRAESRASLHLDLHGAHSMNTAHNFHDSHIPHGPRGLHPGHDSSRLAAGSYATSIPPVSVSADSMTVDWGVYETAHPNLAINPASFDFELPGLAVSAVSTASTDTVGAVGHHTHYPHASADATLAFGNELISPSSIHAQRGTYGFDERWDDGIGREASTSKVATPVGTITTNPWADLDDGAKDDRTNHAQPKRVSRSKRQRKDGRKASEASVGGSSSTGGPNLSVSDPASPSSASQHSRASIGSKSASIVSTASTTSSRQPKLRSASRTSKNSHAKPHDTPEERRTRASHNLVEKQYRNRLNAQFESLLNSLPEQLRAGNASNGGGEESDNDQDRRVSKGEVLEMARKHIQTLEQERSELERENLELQGSLKRLKDNTPEEVSSSSGQGVRLNSEVDDDGKDQEMGQEKN